MALDPKVHRSIEVTCPNGHVFRAKGKYAGRRGKCPECSTMVEVPQAAETIIPAGRSETTKTNASGHRGIANRNDLLELGRFRIERVLGEGAFGTVYLANDPQLDRQVAVKAPRLGALGGQNEATRFLREARAAAQLRHPNIVPIYDAGEVEGTYYIASAFIPPGRTLGDLLKEEGRLDPEQASRLIEQLAAALHYAHSLGVVHRDVKPDNILLDESGAPHIADFGLARREESSALRTQENVRMGTPAYMSPEQHAGKSREADSRSDLWALGVMLYEMLAGQRPFRGNEVQLMYAVRELEPEAPRAKDPSIPRDLETICLKCLAKEPDNRYASCQELAEDLRRWRNSEPITARRVGTIERLWRWSKRNPTVASLVSAVAVLLVVLCIGALAAASYLAHSRQQLASALKKANWATEQATTAAAEADRQRRRAQREAAASKRKEQEAVEAQRQAEQAQHRAEEALARLQAEKAAREAAEQSREQANRARDKAEQKAQAAEAEKNQAVEENLTLGYSRAINDAYLQWRLGNDRDAADLLQQCPPDLRGWEWDYLDAEIRRPKDYVEAAPSEFYVQRFLPTSYLDANELVQYQKMMKKIGPAMITQSRDGRWAATLAPPTQSSDIPARFGCGRVIVWRVLPGIEHSTMQARHVRLSRHAKYLAGLTVAVKPVKQGEDQPPRPRVFAVATLWSRETGEKEELAEQFLGGPNESFPNAMVGLPLTDHRASNQRKYVWTKFAFNPAEDRLAHYFSATGQLSMRSLVSDTTLWTIQPPAEPLAQGEASDSIVFSSDGRKLWLFSSDRLYWLNPETGETEGEAKLNPPLPADSSVTVSDKQTHFGGWVARNKRRWWATWDMESGERVGPLLDGAGVVGQVHRFDLAHDRSWLAMKTGEGVYAWEARRGARQLQAPGVLALAIGKKPTGETEIAVATGTRIHLLGPLSSTPLKTFRGHAGTIRALAVSSRFPCLASAGNDATVRIWDIDSGKELVKIQQPSAGAMAFTPDGERLITGRDNGDLCWWDSRTGQLCKRVKTSRHGILALAISSDGQTIATGGVDQSAFLWDMLTGEKKNEKALSHDGEVRCVQFRHDAKRVITAGSDGMIHIWSAIDGELVKSLREHTRDIRGLAYSPDGSRIFALSGNKANIWDPDSGRKVLEFAELREAPVGMAISQDGTLVVADNSGELRLWSPAVAP